MLLLYVEKRAYMEGGPNNSASPSDISDPLLACSLADPPR